VSKKDHQLHKLFAPRGIAVIGASSKPGKVGYAIVRNLQSSGYAGEIYPINPKAEQILGYQCYDKVENIPPDKTVDLAVIALPAAAILEITKSCSKRGIHFIIVYSAGFKETGPEGAKLEAELKEFCRENDIALLGPNCVGLIDTHTPMNASFARSFSKKGNVAFISQSGAMLVAMMDMSELLELGFSHFVSLGNKTVLNEIDFLQYAAWDPNTAVIICYLEDIVDGKKFLDIAGSISLKKPVIILKSGSSSSGARAASSHTGSLAGADKAYSAAFKQSAVLRASSMEDMFDMAAAFSNQPLPKGNRIAVVTNSGGPGILTTDQIEELGMQMARFTAETSKELRNYLPYECSVYNPVDVLADTPRERFQFSLEKVINDPGVDGIITLLCPATAPPVELAQAIKDTFEKYPEKPILSAFMGGEEMQEGISLLRKAGLPCYSFPERAVIAMNGMVKYVQSIEALRQKNIHRKKTSVIEGLEETSYVNNMQKAQVKAIFYDALKERRVVLLEHEGAQILEAFGIKCAPTYLAKGPEMAAQIAEQIGFPVVLKIASPKILHKTDIGGVLVGVDNTQGVIQGFKDIIQRARHFLPDAPLYGVEVQKMMPQGTETIIGSSYDVQFGPMLVFGLGGIYVNLFEDVSLRLAANLTEKDVEEMISETKAYRLIKGFRGKSPLDLQSLKEATLKLAHLVLEFPEIKEMDINPLMVYEKGICAVDVKITLSHEINIQQQPVEEQKELLIDQLAERRS
jgi:acetyl coenzyme A synthetase (ADP forming)-like protein